MKVFFYLLFSLVFTPAFSQTSEFDSLFALGKAEFEKEYDEQDYALAVSYLEKAVELEPLNPEAHYFLGYAYSRLNSKDGSDIPESILPLTLKSSEHFETVIKLEPFYQGGE